MNAKIAQFHLQIYSIIGEPNAMLYVFQYQEVKTIAQRHSQYVSMEYSRFKSNQILLSMKSFQVKSEYFIVNALLLVKKLNFV